jgi:hypothetical protein
MKRIATHRPEVLARFKRIGLTRPVRQRIRQIERLLAVAGERDHHSFCYLVYHLVRYEQAHAKLKRGCA